jgi:hypothetical protein
MQNPKSQPPNLNKIPNLKSQQGQEQAGLGSRSFTPEGQSLGFGIWSLGF